MLLDRASTWLQITANVGILGGLILVGFQLQQNSQILKAQMLSAESQSMIQQELSFLGEEGAKAWVSAMASPSTVSPEHHRVMEAIYWSALETWRHTEELERLGLADVSAQFRASDEAAWHFSSTYGRAWWTVRRQDAAISDALKQVIDEVVANRPDRASELHSKLVKEIERLEAEAAN